MVKGFEDLANQDVIEYGCLAGSSTLAFFKVSTAALKCLIQLELEIFSL